MHHCFPVNIQGQWIWVLGLEKAGLGFHCSESLLCLCNKAPADTKVTSYTNRFLTNSCWLWRIKRIHLPPWTWDNFGSFFVMISGFLVRPVWEEKLKIYLLFQPFCHLSVSLIFPNSTWGILLFQLGGPTNLMIPINVYVTKWWSQMETRTKQLIGTYCSWGTCVCERDWVDDSFW